MRRPPVVFEYEGPEESLIGCPQTAQVFSGAGNRISGGALSATKGISRVEMVMVPILNDRETRDKLRSFAHQQ